MFKWLINLFSSKSEKAVKEIKTSVVSDEQAVVVEKPYVAPVQAEEAPKPKKKRYYKPKAKKTEGDKPAQPATPAKPRNRKGPELR
jgi:hypothetical protein